MDSSGIDKDLRVLRSQPINIDQCNDISGLRNMKEPAESLEVNSDRQNRLEFISEFIIVQLGVVEVEISIFISLVYDISHQFGHHVRASGERHFSAAFVNLRWNHY